MDIILATGIVLLVMALLGVGGVVAALKGVAWFLLVLAVVVIAWRIVTGRRAV